MTNVGDAAADELETSIHDLEECLRIIDEIPEKVIEDGDQAVQDWVRDRYPSVTENGSLARTIGPWQVAKCTGAVMVAIGSAAVPAAKLLKLRRFIREVGGLRKAAELLIKVARGEEQLAEFGPVIGSLGAEILGIAAIRENCF
ncbi:MAG: hypothetical protein ACRDRP_04895 [Pseudonocardiaceae bacterium]